MEKEEPKKSKPTVRKRAEEIKPFICKNLIAVIESPSDIQNIGTVIRNVNALGVEKVYVVDPRKALPDDWQEMRERKSLARTSVSAVKWSFVKRFDSTDDCFEHLEKNNFHSVVTSPHIKGQETTGYTKQTSPNTRNWPCGLEMKSAGSVTAQLNVAMPALPYRCLG